MNADAKTRIDHNANQVRLAAGAIEALTEFLEQKAETHHDETLNGLSSNLLLICETLKRTGDELEALTFDRSVPAIAA